MLFSRTTSSSLFLFFCSLYNSEFFFSICSLLSQYSLLFVYIFFSFILIDFIGFFIDICKLVFSIICSSTLLFDSIVFWSSIVCSSIVFIIGIFVSLWNINIGWSDIFLGISIVLIIEHDIFLICLSFSWFLYMIY